MSRKHFWNKKLFTRILSVFLSAALSVSAVPMTMPPVQAAYTGTDPADVQSDELQMQTITTSPGMDTEEAVTLDGMMPANAEVSVENCGTCATGDLCAYDVTITDSKGEEFQPGTDMPIQVVIWNTVLRSMYTGIRRSIAQRSQSMI